MSLSPAGMAGHVAGMAGTAGSALIRGGMNMAMIDVTLLGTGTPANADGLTIGAGVNNVVFAAALNALRSISGFGGSGIVFAGGSTRSTLTGITSSGNGRGLLLGAGRYTGTVVSGCSFSGNAQSGVTLTGAKGLALGITGAGNLIQGNGGYGIRVIGDCRSSVASGNTLSGNTLGSFGKKASVGFTFNA